MIRITRRKQFINLFDAYKIYIDGIYCGKIKRNETKEFAVEDGRHTVYARLGQYGSNLLYVGVNDGMNGSIVDIELRNAQTGWNRWLGDLADGNFAKDEYLFLAVRRKEVTDKGKT